MKAKIKLAFRIVITQESELLWDRYVFEDSYLEYKIQHQAFDTKDNPVKNYWELLAKNPNAAQIPYLLCTSISNYVTQLGGVIKSLPDVLGNTFFPIETFNLDLIGSHIQDPAKHRIGLTFYTPTLLLIDLIDGKYLLSKDVASENQCRETFMFAFHPQVAISHYEPL